MAKVPTALMVLEEVVVKEEVVVQAKGEALVPMVLEVVVVVVAVAVKVEL
jgi:hypothetical protein